MRRFALLAAISSVSAATPPLCTLISADLDGNDILPPNPPPTSDGAACCAKCKAHGPSCVAFSYAEDSGTCYLKSKVGRTTKRGDRLSAHVTAACGCTGASSNKCWAAPHPCKGPAPPPGPPSPPAPPPSPPAPAGLGAYRCLPGSPESALPLCDKMKTRQERVDWIISNITSTECVSIIKKGGVGRLQIGSYAMWSTEALHGVRLWPEKCPFASSASRSGCTTIFATASTSSRSWNRSSWEGTGRAMGTEGRTLFNLGAINELSLRGPQVNIQRDPRWGRNSNSPSEELPPPPPAPLTLPLSPYLTGMYGAALVTGTQSNTGGLESGVNMINSQMKHWTGYGVEQGRMGFNGNISVHDMSETYMVPLQLMLKANVSSAMCSYNAINGTPSCANGWMSDRVLRQKWGFQGVIESDCGALSHILDQHHYAKDGVHAAAASMNGTCDVECGGIYGGNLQKAADAGLVSAAQLKAAARRIMMHRFSLGLFDPESAGTARLRSGVFNSSQTVHSPQHAAIAREAAQQAVVVVQNPSAGADGAPLLPLSMITKAKYALIGPMGNVTDVFLGDYRPAACPGKAKPAPEGTSCLPTLLELMQKQAGVGTVAFAPGCTQAAKGPKCINISSAAMQAATAAMAGADVVILTIGEKTTDNDNDGHNTGGEGSDRSSIGLPGQQAQLVAAALGSKKPVVALIFSGGSVSVDALKNAPNAAVVYPGFGGESGQNAVLDVIFGAVPASGRLPWTVYQEAWGNATEMKDMSFQAGDGRSYKYLKKSSAPLWEFGAGLSYTTLAITPGQGSFALSSIAASVCTTIKNTGKRGTPVVVTLFSKAQKLRSPPSLLPNKQLIAFDKVHVAAGATAKVCFAVTDADVASVDTWSGAHVAYAGSYKLGFGDGVSTAWLDAEVKTQRVVAEIPAVDNPQPLCCQGADRSCC